MGDIVINPDTFFERLSSLYNAWKADKRSGEGSFGGADSIVVLTGKADQDTVYTKNNALHVRLRPLGRHARRESVYADHLRSFGFWAMNFRQR